MSWNSTSDRYKKQQRALGRQFLMWKGFGINAVRKRKRERPEVVYSHCCF
jgi:hypothetical protein